MSYIDGASGVEDAYNTDLSGRTPDQQFRNLGDWLIGKGILADGINGVALRSMKLPGTAYDDALLGQDPQLLPVNNDTANVGLGLRRAGLSFKKK